MKNNAALIKHLNKNLADMLDLKLQCKQAHWNIRGENFIAVHELFDKVAGAADEYADLLAERVAQLRGLAEGTLQAISGATALKPYPTDLQDSREHVKLLAAAIDCAAKHSFDLITASDELDDPVTADIFTEVARGLDKWRWFVEAHVV